MASGRVGVIGAGPAGLAAAHRLSKAGHNTTILEAESVPGGLSASYRVDGFAWDFGGHRLLTADPEVMALAADLIGGDLRRCLRLSKVLFQGRFWSQPLEMSNAIKSVRPQLALLAIAGYLAATLRRRRGPCISFEDWVVSHFGRPLYEVFFGPYTRKVWGIDPSLIAPEWAPRRIMVGGLLSLFKAMVIREDKRPAVTARHYFYPRLGSGQLYEALADRCQAAGSVLLYGRRCVSVAASPDQVFVEAETARGREEHVFDTLVNTAPLPDLIRSLRPLPPPDVLESAASLTYRGIVFLFIRLGRSVVLGWDALYVPEPDYLFFRVEEPACWSRDLAPQGKTSLCLEIAADPGDPAWCMEDGSLLKRCLEDLTRMGVVITAREILGYDVVRQRHVYPVQRVDTERPRTRCLQYLGTLSSRVLSIGRQGAFRYLNMDEAIQAGWRAADQIVAWRPPGDATQEKEAGYFWDAKRQLAGVPDG